MTIDEAVERFGKIASVNRATARQEAVFFPFSPVRVIHIRSANRHTSNNEVSHRTIRSKIERY
ncbi:MAG TPA: hypothetical protein VFD48_16110 [Pyrinomonadaceae bacterium]|nr:hypothetical protein [Pyrinomonadaceae bacterium]